jgi:hypothetical protein
MNSKSDSVPASLVSDPSKGISLLFGILLILTVYGLAESIIMLYAGSRASLIELIIFALLVSDTIVLLTTVRQRNYDKPGLLRYIFVWILGLIPYFAWVVVYWVGKGSAEAIQRHRGNAPVIALVLFTGIIVLCSSVYLFTGGSPAAALPAQ